MIYDITPVPKPRMTRRDKWQQRDCVLRYRTFKDLVRYHKVFLPTANCHVTFYIPMPKSWSKKKRKEKNGTLHRQRPDWDNLGKALSDAVYGEDACIADIRITKRWAEKGAIEII